MDKIQSSDHVHGLWGDEINSIIDETSSHAPTSDSPENVLCLKSD